MYSIVYTFFTEDSYQCTLRISQILGKHQLKKVVSGLSIKFIIVAW